MSRKSQAKANQTQSKGWANTKQKPGKELAKYTNSSKNGNSGWIHFMPQIMDLEFH